jgi:hypothetical protein
MTTFSSNKSITVALGDVHGNWTPIVNFEPTDCLIIQVGDFGVGFLHPKREDSLLKMLSESLQEKNQELWVIRGNHDDPSYFLGDGRYEYDHIRFIPDYSVGTLSDSRVAQFIGGGLSIDRVERVAGESYWGKEKLVLKEDQIFFDAQLLFTHVPPYQRMGYEKGAFCTHWCNRDKDLAADLDEERYNIENISRHSKCEKHFSGHMHVDKVVRNDDRTYYSLGINAFREV